MAVEGPPTLERATFKKGRESEGTGLNPIAHHLDEIEKCLLVKAQTSMIVDEGGPVEDRGVRVAVEEGDGAAKTAVGGVGPLELEVEDAVVVEAVAEESGVDLEDVVEGRRVVDEERESSWVSGVGGGRGWWDGGGALGGGG